MLTSEGLHFIITGDLDVYFTEQRISLLNALQYCVLILRKRLALINKYGVFSVICVPHLA